MTLTALVEPVRTEPRDYLNATAPVAVRVIDVDEGAECLYLPASRFGTPYRRLLALVRRDGQPLGWVTLPVSLAGEVSLEGLPEPPSPTREEWHGDLSRGNLADALVTIVVTTCANDALVLNCVGQIRACAVGPVEIVVVENRPTHSTVGGDLLERFPNDDRIHYIEESRPGLSRARNAGLRVARGALVVFTDDDILVDREWLSAIRSAFAVSPQVDCVTGLILPVELETPSQIIVERFASFGKGFVPRIYSIDEPPPDQPLFPYTAGYFGSGANMAFKTDAIRDIGGFDNRLGAGTASRAGEDLDICIRLLQAGGRLAYEPRAIVWHRHPDTHARVRAQIFNYGVGLGAMLSKHLAHGPERGALIRRFPSALRYLLDPASRKNAGKGSDFPWRLDALERLGLLVGPLAYMRSRREVRR